jgi:hypothetical protein
MTDPAALMVFVGLLIGCIIGPIGGSLYLHWLDRHVPNWYERSWWHCWWPR